MNTELNNSKKEWQSPELNVHGSIENITGWIGGNWGEWFGGQGSGWNPWQPPGDGGGVPSGS